MVLIVEWGFKGLLPKRSATGRHAASPLLYEEGTSGSFTISSFGQTPFSPRSILVQEKKETR